MDDVITNALDNLRLLGHLALLAVLYLAVFKIVTRSRGPTSLDLSHGGSNDGGACSDDAGSCGDGGGDCGGGDGGGDCGGGGE